MYKGLINLLLYFVLMGKGFYKGYWGVPILLTLATNQKNAYLISAFGYCLNPIMSRELSKQRASWRKCKRSVREQNQGKWKGLACDCLFIFRKIPSYCERDVNDWADKRDNVMFY